MTYIMKTPRPLLTRLPLWLEIGIALALKIALLYGIHQSFFAHPQAPHMHMAAPVVEQHLLSYSTTPSAQSPAPAK